MNKDLLEEQEKETGEQETTNQFFELVNLVSSIAI